MSHTDLTNRWWMNRTGRYKQLNLIFGLCPFLAAILLTRMREDSPPAQLWLSIVRTNSLDNARYLHLRMFVNTDPPWIR